ncbi:PDR/VanB family oxidoreductase [Craterilacuibacter sinensis]|uniref:2Fe-2S iron-sulfur cluster binding domain-containing protein n=1 Tax=Craterilacuibacter sinensis TaxID=2686017 RepID=A0A845BSS8_9NEIS|nr:PDR/VanB family oxidoreductase [Craterilacuibacter sinensis]MXR37611.1 2Fe-2S iron-sulfur cluster binding domain-containing protein [Craterilacuibacter sinensis]
MPATEWLHATLGETQPLADGICQLSLLPDTPYPPYASGSHLLVRVGGQADGPTNAYSLLGGSARNDVRIAVQRAEASRGGSHWLHTLRPGDRLCISTPANLFPLEPNASGHMFIAGGIGITPFIAHLAALDATGQRARLHYAYRSASKAAFVAELSGYADTQCYDAGRGQRMDIRALLQGVDAHTHVYACGPQRLLDDVELHGADLRAAGRLHIEQFSPPAHLATDDSFTIQLARSGQRLTVAAGESILDAVRRQSTAKVESLCREGYCGTCETRLLSGQAAHRDQYLSDQEKQAQDRIMLCVSRAACSQLVLDL